MPSSSSIGRLHVWLVVTVMAGLGGPSHAQAPSPAPNLALTLRPELAYNVWSGDFNEDGRTDLVAATGTSQRTQMAADLVVEIGRGDGTFLPPRSLGRAALPLTVSDINADGFVDIVIRRTKIRTGGRRPGSCFVSHRRTRARLT